MRKGIRDQGSANRVKNQNWKVTTQNFSFYCGMGVEAAVAGAPML
jgi:hypothetical protein